MWDAATVLPRISRVTHPVQIWERVRTRGHLIFPSALPGVECYGYRFIGKPRFLLYYQHIFGTLPHLLYRLLKPRRNRQQSATKALEYGIRPEVQPVLQRTQVTGLETSSARETTRSALFQPLLYAPLISTKF